MRPTEALFSEGEQRAREGRITEAVDAHRHALAEDPSHVGPYLSLGRLLFLTDDAGAVAALERAVRLEPDNAAAIARLYFQRQQTCDWTDTGIHEERLLALVRRGAPGASPFCLLPMAAATLADQLTAARLWAARFEVPAEDRFTHTRRRKSHRRLRIGYLSADFHTHATAYLAAELFESHDRAAFELFAYSFGPDDASPMRRRLVSAFDHFNDVVDLSDAEAARLIHQDGIDILVDLKGYTGGARPQILARRPAPIQVSFLGYPATMGAAFIDAIIADPVVLPPEHEPFYDEKIVRIAGCYQPNDSRREIAEEGPGRRDCGLPVDATVFCSFNNSYKITPALFAIWMRLLDAVPRSVLWLLETSGCAGDNLRREANRRGIDPNRLVFAPWLPGPDHIRRLGLADLFLDTLPYNAHTTASDALRAGLPIVTCAGDRFAGRVAASLLRAVGLPELIAHSLEDYESLALHLARTPEYLAELRSRLAERRVTSEIFDGIRFAAKLEHAFTTLWEQQQSQVLL